jgi:hypothetical protein
VPSLLQAKLSALLGLHINVKAQALKRDNAEGDGANGGGSMILRLVSAFD